MLDNYLSFSYGQLGASVLLIIINFALSLQLRLGGVSSCSQSP